MLEILRKIGLSEGEIKVYSALLDLGSSSVSELHGRIGMERRNIYDILNKLVEKGLVSYTEDNKKRRFQITHPKKILGYLDEKKKELEDYKDIVSKDLPEIIEKFKAKREGIRAEVFRGVEGLKAVWEDMLNYDSVYWIGAARYTPIKFPLYFASWNRRRVKKKIKVYNLIKYELKGKITPWAHEKFKFLPKEFSGNPTVMGLFGNKVSNFIFGEELFVFVIESKELSEGYKKYHKYLWDNVAQA